MSDTTEILKDQLQKLTDVVKEQQEQLKQLSAMPASIATVAAIGKKSAIVESKGGLLEIDKPKNIDIKLGSSVQLNQFDQIIDLSLLPGGGVESSVLRVIDQEMIAIESPEGDLVIPSNGIKLAAGDSIMLNRSRTAVLRKLPSKVAVPDIKPLTWGDIGGNAAAKEAMIEAVEWPTRMRSMYAKFKKSPLKGVLLYGPPGNGKTMLGRAAATALAALHGAEGRSAFFSIKGPEVLSKWVGEGEANVRRVFAMAQRHTKQHGYPSVLFVDEADSLLRARGHGEYSYTDTIVNQFLVEMDGIEESGVLVILATNRHDILDPAVVREGRVDRKVEVPRPTLDEAIEISGIHLRGIPIEGVTKVEAGRLIATKTFERARNAISGAMLAGVVDRSTSNAIHRSLKETVSGISCADINRAIEYVEVA